MRDRANARERQYFSRFAVVGVGPAKEPRFCHLSVAALVMENFLIARGGTGLQSAPMCATATAQELGAHFEHRQMSVPASAIG
jgi:hypothetical protein